jgi:hypothetical protein
VYLLARHGNQKIFAFALALILGMRSAMSPTASRWHVMTFDFTGGWHWRRSIQRPRPSLAVLAC